MQDFPHRLLILGCGGVGRASLPLILSLVNMKPSNITVMDFVDQRPHMKAALEQGVRFVKDKITVENLDSLLSAYLKAGDILLDLSWNVDTIALLDWCHRHSVRFINTSVEVWDPYTNAHQRHPTELTLYHRQMALRELMRSWGGNKGPTAIVDHGANPGLVSHFAKQGLLDIASKVLELGKASNQASLEKALADENFPQLAYLTGVKTIHISERDTQITNQPKRVNEFVNTWSIEGIIEEGVAPAEMGWGTHEKSLPAGAFLHADGPKNQICLAQKGAKTWVRSYVPSGEITGMVIRHGEAFSISDYLTVWQGDKVIYRPTVHYAYCPCDAAINSLHELEMRAFKPQPQHRLLCNDIIEGHDELGCLLMGHALDSWWIGSVLDINEARSLVPNQSATTVQVAIGVVAALMYAIRHENLGLCLPDHLDHREILHVAKPYLGRVISQPYAWNPLQNAEAFAPYQKPRALEDDVWQFSTFLVS